MVNAFEQLNNPNWMLPIWKRLNITVDWNKEIPLNRLKSLRTKFHNIYYKLMSGEVNEYNGKYLNNLDDLIYAKNFVNKKIREIEVK